ncbi:MAG: glycosyltransferase [Defluviitaleaceae bacterium]|nr:glycosyltransferase [Defluviitaleaceae bacterium]
MDLISVIIPVYNVENFLQRCLNSVTSQTYTRLEIILVNDGSTDNSGKICDEYAGIDNRIIVIHQENAGLSAARNSGLEIATGSYITFVDSDDWLSPDCIEILARADGDISVCNPVYVWENGKTLSRKYSRRESLMPLVMDSVQALRLLLLQTEFDTSAWAKLYKAKIFQDIRFPVGKKYEDMGTIYKLFYASKKIVYCKVNKYYYFQRDDSISAGVFNESKLDYLYFAEEIYHFVSDKEQSLCKPARSRIVSVCFHLLLSTLPMKNADETRRLLHKKIKEYRRGLLHGVRFKVRAAVIFSRLPHSLFIIFLKFFARFNPKNR